jgi:hypothetical protein
MSRNELTTCVPLALPSLRHKLPAPDQPPANKSELPNTSP